MTTKSLIILSTCFVAFSSMAVAVSSSEETSPYAYKLDDPMEVKEQAAKQLVEDAIQFYREHGKDAALAEFQNQQGKFCYSTGENITGLIVKTQEGECISYCKYPGNIGTNLNDWTIPDGRKGFVVIQDAVNKHPDGVIVKDLIPNINPYNNKITLLNVYAKADGDLVFIGPMYREQVMKGMKPLEDVQKMMKPIVTKSSSP